MGGRASSALENTAQAVPVRRVLALSDWIHALVPTLLIFAWFTLFPHALVDGDTSWHVAAGEWIVSHRAIPHSDPFSYTFGGQPWTAHEWLAEVLMYGLWTIGSWGAVALVCGGALAAACWALTLHLRRWLGFPAALIPLAFVTAALLPAAYARPHVFGWALAVFWLLGLVRAREHQKAPPAMLVLIMLVWANMHGSFMLGLGLAGWFALEALIEAVPGKRIAVALQWAGFGVLSGLAALMTPHGIEGLLFPLKLTAMAMLPMIEEWRAAQGIREVAMVLLPLIAALLLWRRVPLLRIVLIAVLTFMAMNHLRHHALQAIVAAVLLAKPLGEALGKAELPKLGFHANRAAILGVTGLALAALSMTALWRFVDQPESQHVPAKAIAAIPEALLQQRVFNGYSFGGPLIKAGVPVYIDGRADIYGTAFMRDYLMIYGDGNVQKFEAARRRWHFVWTILPSDGRIPAYLDTRPEWVRIYRDQHAAIHVLRSELK